MLNRSKAILAGFILSVLPLTATADPIKTGFYGFDESFSDYGSLVIGSGFDAGQAIFNAYEYNGVDYDFYLVNENGNLTSSPSWGPIDSNVPVTQALIAPFLTGIDTSCMDCGSVYLGYNPDTKSAAVTWVDVAEAGSDSADRNTFQMVIIDRAEEFGGYSWDNDYPVSSDYDIEFRYGNIEWNGSAFGDEDGAVVGAGSIADDAQNIDMLPVDTSTLEGAQKLVSGSNVNDAGVWRYEYRNGQLSNSLDNVLADAEPEVTESSSTGEGSGTEEDPFMPVEGDPELPGWAFDLIVMPGDVVFIDPDVAIGYDYFVDSGSNFASVVLPTGFDDDLYDLWLQNASGEWEDTGIDINGGIEYSFGALGVSAFRIMGIDLEAMLDPTDPTAFVTGVSFINDTGIAQSHSIRQVAVVETVDDATAVNEPNTIALLGLAMGALVFIRNRRKKV